MPKAIIPGGKTAPFRAPAHPQPAAAPADPPTKPDYHQLRAEFLDVVRDVVAAEEGSTDTVLGWQLLRLAAHRLEDESISIEEVFLDAQSLIVGALHIPGESLGAASVLALRNTESAIANAIGSFGAEPVAAKPATPADTNPETVSMPIDQHDLALRAVWEVTCLAETLLKHIVSDMDRLELNAVSRCMLQRIHSLADSVIYGALAMDEDVPDDENLRDMELAYRDGVAA